MQLEKICLHCKRIGSCQKLTWNLFSLQSKWKCKQIDIIWFDPSPIFRRVTLTLYVKIRNIDGMCNLTSHHRKWHLTNKYWQDKKKLAKNSCIKILMPFKLVSSCSHPISDKGKVEREKNINSIASLTLTGCHLSYPTSHTAFIVSNKKKSLSFIHLICWYVWVCSGAFSPSLGKYYVHGLGFCFVFISSETQKYK